MKRCLELWAAIALFACGRTEPFRPEPFGPETDPSEPRCVLPEPEEIGACCEAVPGGDPARIPNLEPDDPTPVVLALDPVFLCSELACVAHPGGRAYCTEPCSRTRDCPDGFACERLTDESYCVKSAHDCTKCL